jgi:hypothetical protein
MERMDDLFFRLPDVTRERRRIPTTATVHASLRGGEADEAIQLFAVSPLDCFAFGSQ